jgi:hypothetical protein
MCVLLIADDLGELSWRPEGDHEPQYHELQDWMFHNIDDGETVLMSADLYKEHLLEALSGGSVLVRHVEDSSEYPIEWLESSAFDLIVVNKEAQNFWPLFDEQLISNNWCTVHDDGSYVALREC